jgi:hypothetical protein
MRTTSEQVRALGQIADSVNVIPYIEMATEFVTQLAACDKSLTSSRLELIERNLACHFAFTSGVPTAASVSSKSIGGASTSYNRMPAGNGLQGSPYGLAALQLDTKRCLVGIMDGPVEIIWLGKKR